MKLATPPSPRLITLKNAARISGIAYTSLRDIAMRGEIAIVRVGRALYVEHDAVDRWVDAHREHVA